MTGLDPAMAAALDSLSPPAMSADFAERVMAVAMTKPALLPNAAPRRTRRSRWARGRNMVFGLAGFSLLSAAAAASGLLGKSVQSLPVIAQIAERITAAPEPRPKPRPVPRKTEPVSVPEQPVASEAEPAITALPVERDEVRRELIARRIAQRIDERMAERGAMRDGQGRLPIPPQMRERLRQLSPEERRALLERVREIRREQAGEVNPAQERAAIIARAKAIEERRAARRAESGIPPDGESYWRPRLTAEQRQELRAALARKRALRDQPTEEGLQTSNALDAPEQNQ